MQKEEKMDFGAAKRRLKCVASHLTQTRDRKDSIENRKLRVAQNKTKAKRYISKNDLLQQRENGRVWIVIHRKVYDVTDFLEEHPGGAEIITDIDWDDFETMNAEFDDAEHSEEALDDMKEVYQGRFLSEESEDDEEHEDDDDDDEDEDSSAETEAVLEDDANFLDDFAENSLTPFARFQEFELPLIDKHTLSHDVTVFRFALPMDEQRFGLPIGKHIVLSFSTHDGQKISRPYTPVSPKGEVGFVDFLVKLYPTGKMSNHLSHLAIGETIHMRGPKGKLEYLGRNKFRIRNKTKIIKQLGMIAGGSGITPMFQVLQSVANDPEGSDLEISLLFANKSEDDIILRSALESFSKIYPKMKLFLSLDNPPAKWSQFTGFVTKDMILQTMPRPTNETMVLLCGPPPMIKKACIPNLLGLGYTRENYFHF